MFCMIHASDHKEASVLMVRAYRNILNVLEPLEDLQLELGGITP